MKLVVENLSKRYGEKLVVDNVSFTMDKPTIFGFLGTNGAGKTTSIRMILNIIKKNSGKVLLNGKNLEESKFKIGYLPEERGLYPKTTIYNQLMYFSNLKGINTKEADKDINYWLEKLEITEYKNYTPEKLSKGNAQKAQFILSLLNKPDIIFLDEPFSGLDPVNNKLLKDIVLDLKNEGKYIILSSHQMSDVEELVDDLLILDRGKTVLQGNLSEIRNSYKANHLYLETDKDVSKLLNLDKKEIKGSNIYLINISDELEGEKILKSLIKEKIKIIKYELKKPTLNEIFIEKVGGKQ